MKKKYLFALLILSFLSQVKAGETRDSVQQESSSGVAMLSTVIPSFTMTQNYVVKTVYLDPTSTNLFPRSVRNVTYFDGFRRKLQEIQVEGSPGAIEDIIVPYTYGIQGRVEKEYLPYNKANNNGAFDANATRGSNWNIYGTEDASFAFTKTEYDNSPLDRVIKKMGPGKKWHMTGSGKGISTTYGTNVANEVRLYHISPSGSLQFNDTYYDAGSLQKVSTIDEDGIITEIFTDRNNKVILMINYDGSDRFETYSVYDERGLPRYVLSPEASLQLQNSFSDIVVLRLAYRYEYDSWQRMIVKKNPGCDPVYMVYDKRDRLVMSQDGKQRAENVNKWRYNLYDNMNRVIETGDVISIERTHAELQSRASSSLNYVPEGTRTPFQFTLYDSYVSTTNVPVRLFKAVSGYSDDYHKLVAGLVTGVNTRILGTDIWLTTTIYYDNRCRKIQVISDNILGRLSQVDFRYDFASNVLQQRESHAITNSQVDVLETINSFDNRGRLLSSITKLNNGIPATVTYLYNAIGRLVSKKYGNIMETLTYNTRGWLTGKTSVPFKMKLRYESPEGGTSARWNGIISECEWQHGTDAALMYGFTYDNMNRLAETVQKQKNSSTWNILSNNFLEKGITYDRNGNIKTLQRTAGGEVVDNLVYLCVGNQLTELTESTRTSPAVDIYSPGTVATGRYTYDKNGNMVTDTRKSRVFSYNMLNLVSDVKDSDGNLKAKYSYLADGSKLSVRDGTGSNANGIDYLGSLKYKKNGTGLQLESADFVGGVIGISNTNQQVIKYYLTDHLGSVRVIIDASGAVRERNDYYPFGAQHLKSNYPQDESNRDKYNGKEKQTTGNLDYLDYGARMYDNKLGRWLGIDPLAEKYYSISPYAYCSSDPVNKIDPNGKDYYFFNQFGSYLKKLKEWGTHKMIIHTVEKTKDGDEYDSYRFVDFADPVEDPKNIDNGTINRIIFVSDNEVRWMLEEQGAFTANWFKFGQESAGTTAKFDYSYKVLPKKYEGTTSDPNNEKASVLFLVEGDHTAHNQANFGNYLWAATGYVVGFDLETLQFAAHVNSVVNPGRNGYHPQLDSDDDQYSIMEGYRHAEDWNYKLWKNKDE